MSAVTEPVEPAEQHHHLSDEIDHPTNLTFIKIALILAAIGLYAVMAFSVSQRTREVGIRMALGAAPATVRRMILREGVGQVAVGMVLGLAFAALISRMIFMPSGGLAETPLWPRLVAAAVALGAFYLARRNLFLGVLAGFGSFVALLYLIAAF